MEYKGLYEWGVEKLKASGIEEAALDARLLLEECCGTDRNHLLVHGRELVTEEQHKHYVNWIEKRGRHVPLQHILGYQEFMGLRFGVDGSVLIPRQDTETLVEEVLRSLHDGMSILDMCTGSGCILLSLLRYSNDCTGVGCDISEKAIETARTNAVSLGLEAQFLQSDLFENVSGKYEIIVSNPPYIPSGEIPGLMEEVRDFDPLTALDGGEDGLFFYREIIPKAGEYLHPGGMLFLEIGCEQAADVKGLMKQAGYKDILVCEDFTGRDRVVSGRFGG
ncbi:MAG: peptide chain release factor N(5)-glutamine methyltransferase [Lachnospiraceae bacterium]|nr:peptide chain release factor N(5)-glutamine methyltransferase [Lachnospiraceae bacterium]MDE7334309.1 peptide chain release factor N(5)-glutamine methyltransferase [Lachnospiraceae bacterium]